MPNPTTYRRPQSLDETLHYLSERGTVALAGGGLLFGMLDLPYSAVIDLQDVRELSQIERTEEGLTIGAAVRLQQVIESPYVPHAITRAITRTIPINLRNNVSVGESLMLDQPPAEWVAMLAALESRVKQIGPDPEDLRLRSLENYLRYGERQQSSALVTHVLVPLPATRSALGAAYVARTPADEPIVCAAANIVLSDAGRVNKAVVALCGASPAPVLPVELSTLVGNPLDEANIASAVKLVATSVHPVADYRGSVEYRREMARVTAQRALMECLEVLSAE